MEREYEALAIHELGAGAGFRRPTQARPAKVSIESPALEVMTDLARVTPATIRPQAPLAGANQFMITRGVRLLLVVDDHEEVLGLITATDVLGERPMLVATERGLRRDELTVADIMIPAERVEAIAFADLAGARADGDRRRGRAHLLGDRRRHPVVLGSLVFIRS
jgi:CBS domain-containing protein